MKKYFLGMAAALLAAVVVALPARAAKAVAKEPGTLIVYGNDTAKLFSQDGINRAKSTLSSSQFEDGLRVTVDTYPEPPADKRAAAKAAAGDKAKWHRFMSNWVADRAQSDKTRGIYILICAKPGGVAIIADKETRKRGLSSADEQSINAALIKSFQDAAKETDAAKKLSLHDAGLQSAAEQIVSKLKDTNVAVTSSTSHTKSGGNRGMGIAGWICIGIVVLLVIWLIVGVIRALTHSGGGGGGGFGGGGGGGGGGGFMTGMLGGLFGSMAGMWLYNNMFGHSSMLGGGDNYTGDSYSDSSGNGDTGAGDFSGDDGAAGGFDDGGGDAGGGDFGGGGDWGGGDAGGGGDFGGGGGDF